MFVIYTSDETLYHTERTKRDVVAEFVTSNLIQEYRMSNNYIYESPDGGKTVTRRKFGDTEKETIITPPDDELTLRFESIKKKLKAAQLRAHWFRDNQNEQTISEARKLIEELEHEFHCTPLRANHNRLPTDND
jgi:cell fate (sporulation/competence/biofilm development) regulator YmcA (YheA/YmcA/DUF963 family)